MTSLTGFTFARGAGAPGGQKDVRYKYKYIYIYIYIYIHTYINK